MQKKIIALAIAGLVSGAAFAQSNVTVYGIMDVAGINFVPANDGYIKNGAGIKTAIAPGAAGTSVKSQRGFDDGAVGSRLGFKGEEGLGNGLKAEFTYELGLAPTNTVANFNAASAGTTGYTPNTAGQGGLNNLSTRQAFVALNSDKFGQFAFGRFQTAGWEWQGQARPWGGLDTLRTASNVFGMSLNTSDRISNAARWTSPTYSGFLVTLAYSADNSANDSDVKQNDINFIGSATSTLALGRQSIFVGQAKYVNGPIYVNSVYRQTNRTDQQYFDDSKREYALSGAYDFGVAKLGLNIQTQQMGTARRDAANTNTNGTNMPGALLNGYTGSFQNAKVYGGYVTVPFGSQFLLSLQVAKGSGDNGTGSSGYGLYGQYLFSKRTSIYLEAAHMNTNGANAQLGNAVGMGSYSSSTAIEAGKSFNGGMVGLLHTF